ncbi:adventurous gliding motility protein GltJ [Myxococcaceae bacterium JPH2]|nr:adventurous gliding motility protein GltJ [Myxococcaceae bacterium JPH2]
MRFVCDSCRAQYMISDDKVGSKGVKVRCKKCGHTILVRPAGAPSVKEGSPEIAPVETTPPAAGTPRGAEPAGTGLPASLGTPPEGGLFTDVEEDEIGAVFDQVLSSGSHKIPAGEAVGATKDAASETVRRLAEAEETESAKEDAKPNAAAHEWYVAIEEKQVGPWSVEKVKDAWERGEVGPDSLCWRSGFSDWIPLSETAELASVLAPRPSKPVIVAPAPVSSSSPSVVAGPVESAFSAGSSKSGRTDTGVGVPLAPAEESVGWKPSAASVLASLVKEENEALAKPPPRPAPSLEKEPVSQSRLLDVPIPPPEPLSSPGAPMPMMGAPMAPAPMAYPPQHAAPAYAQAAPAYAQPAYAQPAPAYPPPGYPVGYPPPQAAPPAGKSKMPLIAGGIGGVLIVGVLAVLAFSRGGNARGEETPVPSASPSQVAAATPRPSAEMPPMPAAPVGTVQTPPPATAQATATPPPGTTAPAGGAPVAAAGTPPVAAAVTPPAGGTSAPVAAATPPVPTATAAVTPPPVAAPPTPVAAVAPANPGTPVARVDRTPTTRRTGTSSRAGGHEEETHSSSQHTASTSSNAGGGDDEFDDLFGTKKAQPVPKPGGKTPTTYIPPEPGGSMPDTLQQSDIMQVVLSNKPAIVKCVSEQKKKDPALSGKLVMRWTVQTSGKTTAVSCRTDEFRSSYMASCISGLIKGWTFPRHKRQGDPIDFPFTF